jgi:hypothetical protein
MDNFNVFEQGELIVTDKAPGDPEEWIGLENKKLKLPTNFRGGASYRFNEEIEVGFDAFIPIQDHVPGAYDAAIFGVGAHYNPAEWVQLSTGLVTGGDFGTNIPLGVTFIPVKEDEKTWEIGLSFRDFLSLFKNNDPTVGLCFGFLRFSFGQKESTVRYMQQ